MSEPSLAWSCDSEPWDCTPRFDPFFMLWAFWGSECKTWFIVWHVFGYDIIDRTWKPPWINVLSRQGWAYESGRNGR